MSMSTKCWITLLHIRFATFTWWHDCRSYSPPRSPVPVWDNSVDPGSLIQVKRRSAVWIWDFLVASWRPWKSFQATCAVFQVLKVMKDSNNSESKVHLYTAWWFGTFFIFHFIYGMSSFPLTFIFFKMVIAPPTSITISSLQSLGWSSLLVVVPSWVNVKVS